MANFIPEEKVSEIRHASDIIGVISESVLLKKAGSNHIGLCPFHSEKTPSFTVNPAKQIFHCFGCGTGGNVFSFVMKHFGISFPESVKMLGKRNGIEIETREMTPQQKRMLEEREGLLALNAKSVEFYRKNLSDEQLGRTAREYLARRGITEKTIDEFELGFVPDGWDNMVKFYKSLGISKRIADASGLVLVGKKGGYYDRFRNRIIFPIRDVTRQVIGFGGRVMDDSMPKYMNSPETVVYNKSKSLYGLFQAKSRCRQKGVVFIVEGYFDCTTLSQYGVENVVATLGTAMTSEHVRLLKGYAEKMILVYDSDEAGVKAAMRSVSVFVKESADGRIVVLPQGHDPDTYVREFGAEAFDVLAEKALPVIPFLMAQAIKKHGNSVEGRLRIIDDLKDPLAEVLDSVARSLYIKELAEKIGIEESAVLERMNDYRHEKKKNDNRGLTHGLVKQHSLSSSGQMESGQSWDIRDFDRLEVKIISMMLQFSEILPEIIEKNVLNYFNSDVLKSVGLLILKGAEEGRELSDLMAVTENSDQMRLMASLAVGEDIWVKERCVALVEQFMSVRRRVESRSLLERIKAAENSKNHELLMELLKQRNQQISNR